MVGANAVGFARSQFRRIDPVRLRFLAKFEASLLEMY
jgi:hypothetical protein